MNNRNRIIIFLIAWLMPLAMVAQTNHWTPQPSGFENYMPLTNVIQINGVEQQSTALEVGAFCGAECRGSALPMQFPGTGRYVVFLAIYGVDGDQFTFKLYDHNQGTELNLQSPNAVTFNPDGLGSVGEPYVLNFTAINYTISASASPTAGGSVSGAGTYQSGSTCTLTATPNTGYNFVRWTKNGTQVSTSASYSFTVTESASYVAVFSLKSYTISASASPSAGGSVSGGGTYSHGSTCTLTATANTGYTFTNWTKNGTVVSTSANYSFTVTGNGTYVANFSQNTYTISASASPSAGGTVSGGGTYSYGSTCNLTATPATGYNFVRWTRNGSQVSTSASYSFTVTENASYVAVFSLKSYTISASASPSAGGSVSGAGTYNHGSTCNLTATANTGYTFTNWTKNGTVVSTNANYSFTVTGNGTYVANFSQNSYTISASASPSAGGTVSGGGTYNHGSTCTLTATPATGYNFVRWTKNGSQVSTSASYSFTVTESASYVAVFSLKSYTISASASPTAGGSVSGAGTYNHGSTCTLTATANTGYTFTNWTKNGTVVSTNANYSFTVTGNGSYVANFSQNTYTISASASPTAGGSVSGAGTYQQGSTCTLTATPATGYNFVRWTKNGTQVSTSASYSFTVTENASYVAVFSLKSYTISASASPSTGGSVSGAGTYNYGATCTLTASANENYVFINWMEGGTIVSVESTYSFEVTENRTLVAKFTDTSIAGKLNGLFSVGENSYVKFSQGNLQYKASTNTWRFAESQLENVGAENASISEANSGWIDLFGWGTSGYDHGAVCYQPWSTNDNNSYYYAYGNWQNNLNDQSGQADWGYNPISNGGNIMDAWHTLTQPEWDYVFNIRTTTSGIRWAKGTVDGVPGLILLPNSWDVSIYALNDANGGHYNSNNIAADVWANVFEAYGAVFLPASGLRDGIIVSDLGNGYYWSASYLYFTSQGACSMHFGDNYFSSNANRSRRNGLAVRLVQSVPETTVFNIRVTPNPIEGGIIIGAGIYEEGATCTLTATANAGYTFINWTKNGTVVSTNANYSFTVTGSGTYVANFSQNTYTISASASPSVGGTVSGGGTYNYGSTCTLTATANEGYTFINWTKNGELNMNCTSNITFVADAGFGNLMNPYQLSFTSNRPQNPLESPTNPENVRSVGTHWTFNPYLQYNMTLTGVLYLDGESMQNNPRSEYLEIGAFCGDECRGSFTSSLLDLPFCQGYVYQMQIYSNVQSGEEITFRIWDHEAGEELITDATYSFTVTESEEYVAHFNLNSYEISALTNPSGAGTITGTGTYNYGATCTLTATAATGYTFTNWTENGEVVSTEATYSFTVTGDRDLVANFVDSNLHNYVDLGLPSGLLWATCNVGASVPEACGDYFAWGETQPKSSYSWSTYQYCHGSSTKLTKYCNNSSYGYNGFTDNLTTLLPEDDAATASWGDGWRIPTKVEWQELYNNTTSIWTTQNGVYGRLFTAANGNSLFLPAAGYLNNSSLTENGVAGDYLSSTLYTSNPSRAWEFNFGETNYGVSSYGHRRVGLSVRAVRELPMVTASVNPAEGGTVSGGGPYEEGATCTLMATAAVGYTFTNWTENGTVVSTEATYSFTVTGDRDLVANFVRTNVVPGQLHGVFSVGENTVVNFSQGNLQYQASSDTWRFATNQWDYVGANNTSISQTYSGWIDFFGWGTSGWNNGNTYYHPWDSNNSDGSLYGPTGNYDLTGDYANADWGIYNAISNGGNTANQWRTLTQPEWDYVFNTRTTTSGIRYAKAKVNNVSGVILLPDDWNTSTYSLSNTNSSGASFSSNTLTASQWSTLEQAGAVFLPAAGRRNGTSVSNVGSSGSYWSASCNLSSSNVSFLNFYGTNLNTSNNTSRFYGFSVRLVRPAQSYTQTTNLSQGWNWFSTNVEITLDDLKSALLTALPETSITIKGKSGSIKYIVRTHSWNGTLDWDITKMYKIDVPSACEITLEGDPIIPADHPITIVNGPNWIGYPLAESMTVTAALAGFGAVNGDVIKSRSGSSRYWSGSWRPNGLNTLEPGQGYIFNSAATGNRTLVFPSGAK